MIFEFSSHESLMNWRKLWIKSGNYQYLHIQLSIHSSSLLKSLNFLCWCQMCAAFIFLWALSFGHSIRAFLLLHAIIHSMQAVSFFFSSDDHKYLWLERMWNTFFQFILSLTLFSVLAPPPPPAVLEMVFFCEIKHSQLLHI